MTNNNWSCRVCREVYHVDAGSPFFTCCNINQCIVCNEEFGENHLEKVCIGRVATLEDRLNAAVVRRCPNCSYRFEKTEGCNEMKCSNFGSKFCYLCGKAIGREDHFCRCPSRFKVFSKDCTCGRECLQWGDANEYDAVINAKIKAEYAGSSKAELARDIGKIKAKYGIVDLAHPAPPDVITIDEADDVPPHRRVEAVHLRGRRRRLQNAAGRFYNVDNHRQGLEAVQEVTVVQEERGRFLRNALVMLNARDPPPVADYIQERERLLPANQEIAITYRAIGASDIEAVRGIYEFLSNPIPRHPELFEKFRRRINQTWRARIQRYLNIPNGYMDEQRRYTTRDGRNGFALFLFERVRIVL
uniref:RING-type domain-containing protein n=1 Tax=Panagrolaimus sp. PS1159 TaxID=55785 RepID=A0AC35FY52_9BILA